MKAAVSVVGAAAMAAMVSVTPVKASDPVGVYALVDHVVFQPNQASAKAVQVWGVFAVAVQPPGRSYKPEEAYGKVEKGYLLYTCPAGKTAACAAEWQDLRSVAGTDDVVGFGTRWGQSKPHVHPAGEATASPDLYEMNVGVVKIGRYAEYPSIVAALKAAAGRK